MPLSILLDTLLRLSGKNYVVQSTAVALKLCFHNFCLSLSPRGSSVLATYVKSSDGEFPYRAVRRIEQLKWFRSLFQGVDIRMSFISLGETFMS